ncbi:MAG: DNA integrity scanning protein DisA nucleotide-binding domain protein, partial [Candidatus Omnitrophota bacterium]
YIESGVVLDARITSDLIEAVFTPRSILHDGGLIIQHGRIAAAGCLFPLTQSQELSRIYGTRHRAALGLSEETDAIVIVVSEERQDVSLVYRGQFYRDLNKEELFSKVKEIIKLKKEDDGQSTG